MSATLTRPMTFDDASKQIEVFWNYCEERRKEIRVLCRTSQEKVLRYEELDRLENCIIDLIDNLTEQ